MEIKANAHTEAQNPALGKKYGRIALKMLAILALLLLLMIFSRTEVDFVYKGF